MKSRISYSQNVKTGRAGSPWDSERGFNQLMNPMAIANKQGVCILFLHEIHVQKILSNFPAGSNRLLLVFATSYSVRRGRVQRRGQ
jgi:hypothetical protein